MKEGRSLLTDHQLKIVVERIIEEYIKGGFNDDPLRPATIPSAYDISRAASQVIQDVGRPTLLGIREAVRQVSIDPGNGEVVDYTSASKFNKVLYALIDDITTLTNSIVSQVYTITRQFSASEFEMHKMGIRLRKLHGEVQRILLTHRNGRGFLHAIGDTFDSSSNVSLLEAVEITDGAARLKSNNLSTINLRSVGGLTYQAFVGRDYISNNVVTQVHTLGTTVYDMIDESSDTHWAISFKPGTEFPGNTSGAGVRILVPLTTDGSQIRVDTIYLNVYTDYGKEVEVRANYSNRFSNGFAPIGNRSSIKLGGSKSNLGALVVDPTTILGGSDPGMSMIELILHKPEPDAGQEYIFGIKSLQIVSEDHAETGTLITNSMNFSTSESSYSANQLSLFTDQYTPSSTRIDYYVAPDPWNKGYLTLGGNPVDTTKKGTDTLKKSDVDGFTEDNSYTGTTGVRSSELSRLGIQGWESWEPYWIPIVPVNAPSNTMSASGTISDRIVNLGAYEVKENVSDFMKSLDSTTNGINYYRIYNFSDEPKSVTLRQGKRCWIQRENQRELYKTVEVTATFLSEVTSGRGEKLYIYVGPDYNNAVGYVQSPGPVLRGSIDTIMWVDANIDDHNQSISTTDNLADLRVADAQIEYDDTTATINKNSTATYSFPGNTVKFRYTYLDVSAGYSIVETSIYVPYTATPYLTINSVNGIRSLRIEAPDSDSILGTVYSHSQLKNGSRLQLLSGWNRVIIYLDIGVVWNPATSITIPAGLSYYAHYAPLELVGLGTLYYNTHRDDHSRCAVKVDGSNYYLVVNDPVAPAGTLDDAGRYNNDGVIYWNEYGVGITLGSSVFTSAATVNAFYDLDYKVIGQYYTHVILKAVLTGTHRATPVLYSYEVRGGDELRIVVGQ